VYAPNSFGGPQASDAAGDPSWPVAGEIVRAAYTRRRDDDDFSQARDLYEKVLEREARQRLVSNIVGHLRAGVPRRSVADGPRLLASGVGRPGRPGRAAHRDREVSAQARGARASCIRELTPSFRYTFSRWYSTVAGLTNRWAATSPLVGPSTTSRTTCASCGVSTLSVSARRCRACSPVALSSTGALGVTASAPMSLKISKACRSWSRASRRRRSRRSHSP
jgi:hypothetical protein